MQSIYYVQGFRAGDAGPRAAVLLMRGREAEAMWAAQLLAERYDGVLAWRQDGDEDEGWYEEPVVLVNQGRVPDIGDLRGLA